MLFGIARLPVIVLRLPEEPPSGPLTLSSASIRFPAVIVCFSEISVGGIARNVIVVAYRHRSPAT